MQKKGEKKTGSEEKFQRNETSFSSESPLIKKKDFFANFLQHLLKCAWCRTAFRCHGTQLNVFCKVQSHSWFLWELSSLRRAELMGPLYLLFSPSQTAACAKSDITSAGAKRAVVLFRPVVRVSIFVTLHGCDFTRLKTQVCLIVIFFVVVVVFYSHFSDLSVEGLRDSQIVQRKMLQQSEQMRLFGKTLQKTSPCYFFASSFDFFPLLYHRQHSCTSTHVMRSPLPPH